MPFEIIPHVADAGVKGIGETLEEAFCEAAKACFALMVDLAAVRPEKTVVVEVNADTPEGLLVAWLGELLARRDIDGLVFSEFSAKIEKELEGFRLVGWAAGEPVDPVRHRPGVEVKAATYLGVKVEKQGNFWIAQCVVDV